MDDGIPFKAFLYMEDGSKPEVRRFGMDKPVCGKMKLLLVKLREVYPKLKVKNYTVAWKDEDDDEVLLSSDDEIETMYQQCHDNVLKLIVRCIGPKKEDNNDVTEGVATPGDKTDNSNAGAVHQGITCDVCGSAVVGFRYKCITCDDYDLCVRCENEGKHPEHCVVRVPIPHMSLPLIKATIKKSRRFLKSVASQAHEESKKQRRERGKPTSEPDQTIQGKQDSQPGASRTWVQIFGKYLEEFTNLAGDLTRSPEKPESESTKPSTSTEPSTSAEPQSQVPSIDEISLNPWNLPKEDLEKLQHACKFMRHNAARTSIKPMTKVFNKILEIAATYAEEATTPSLARASSPMKEMTSPQSQQEAGQQAPQSKLDAPRLIKEALNVAREALKVVAKETSGEAKTSKTLAEDDKTTEKPTTSGKGTPDAEVPVDNGKNVDIPDLKAESPKGELSSNASSCSSEGHGPDKAEGWTVIDEPTTLKDPFYVSHEYLAVSRSDKPKTADLLKNPGHFEAYAKGKLQGQTKENLRVIYPSAKPAPIYPPLNTATAVLDPNETHVAASAAATSALPTPKTETTSASNTTKLNHAKAAQARAAQAALTAQHLRAQLAPHVDAAVNQMEAMGFSNESGWLTQLLDHNDGNIATVLDLITPGLPPPK